MKFIPISFLTLLLVASSCKKDHHSAPDYRDKYTGEYNCFRLCTFWMMNQPQTDTLYNDTITIVVKKHMTVQNSLVVDGVVIPMDTTGSYHGTYSIPGYKHYILEFISDSISLRTFDGGLAGGTTCRTNGRK